MGPRRALIALMLASTSLPWDAPAYTAPATASDARIRRVEQGLLPAVRVLGESLATRSLWGEMERRKVPGVSIAVIDGGRIAWAKAYGVAEAGTTDSVTPDTRFQAGSVSKPVAAMAALHLVEQGRVSLDGDVNQALRSWKIPPGDSSKGVAITLRMLLTHSAGLTVHGFPGYGHDDTIPSVLQILDGVRPANTPPIRVDIRPGSRFRYSGGGYTVAQQLLVDVTGEPFDRLVGRTLLGPLAMTHSTFEHPRDPVPGVPRARGHGTDGAVVPGGWHRHPELAAAGLWTTPGDLARVVLEVQGSIAGTSKRVLSPATARRMLTPQINATQGIGWRLAGEGASARFEHSGDTEGYACMVVAYLHRGQGAIVMTNGNGGGSLAQWIVRGIANEYGWPDYLPPPRRVVPVPEAARTRLVGRYTLEANPGIQLDIATSGDSLFATVIQPGSEQRIQLLAESATRFFGRDAAFELVFEPDSGGPARGMRILQGTEEYRATRVP